MAEEIGRGQGQGLAGVRNLDPDGVHGGRPRRQDGRGAVGQSFGHEIEAVAGRAGQGGEEIARPDRLRVVGEARDLGSGRAAVGQDGDAGEHVLERHGISPFFNPALSVRAGRGRSGGTRR